MLKTTSKDPFAELLRLEQLVLNAESITEAGFILVNETRTMAEYSQAALLQGENGNLHVKRLSNISEVDRTTPYVFWCEELAKQVDQTDDANKPHVINATVLTPELRRDWAKLSNPHLLWLPLRAGWRGRQGVLLLGRDKAWSEKEIALLSHLSSSYAHSLLLNRPRFAWRKELLKPAVWISLGLLLLTLIIPVRLSVLAPAEVTPRDPWIITAPLNGVVSEVLVMPNQPVTTGDMVVKLDDTELKNRFRVAQSALTVAETELHQMRQSGFSDPRNKSKVLELEAQVDLKKVELEWSKSRLEQTQLLASTSGIAIVDHPQEWRGRPVQVGERILQIANPDKVELTIMVPVRDAISLETDSEARLFLDTDPLRALNAKLLHAAHEPEPGIDDTPSYRVIARITEDAIPRIGLRGTAKVYGEKVSLFYYLFRRPITYLRQHLGW